jgi:hypothetical protein
MGEIEEQLEPGHSKPDGEKWDMGLCIGGNEEEQ